MPTVTATELHDRTAELTERAMAHPDKPIIVEKRGKPAVVLVDADYFEGLLETLDLLSDPAAMVEIRAGLSEEAAGKFISHEQVAKLLGLNVRKTKPANRRTPMDPSRQRGTGKNRKQNRPTAAVR